jgi:3-oxoacyl-[acyl-carrier-protein] synthase II
MMVNALVAAGEIEAEFEILEMRGGFLPPNINFSKLDPAWTLEIVENSAREAQVKTVLSNSFGFGGTNASIILQAA